MARRTPRRSGTALAVRNGGTGAHSKLTPRTADAIIHAVLEGNHLTTAAASAGIGQSTLYRWLDAANAVEEAIENGETPDQSAMPYVEFRDRLAEARAQAEMNAVKIIHRAMSGGYVKSERPLQDAEGNAVYDQNSGEVLMERVWAEPDGRLALNYLARSRPNQWGQGTTGRVEVTGAGGGPVQHEHEHSGDQITALSERLSEVLAQRQQDGDVDDTIDAEEVTEEYDG